MKATDLMIGDWLQYKGQFNASPFRVEHITKRKVGYHAEPNENRMHYLRLFEALPIPLTPEIMKRNGFKTAGCDYVFTDSDPDIVIDLFEPNNPRYKKTKEEYQKEVGISLLQSNYLFGPLDAAIIIKAYYVHELQHFIKPCGIEREIVI